MVQESGWLIVVSAASGTGKTTLIKLLRELKPNLGFSVSATTRPPRPGEENGRDYHFLTDAEFDLRVASGDFLEWAQVHGRKYGTLLEKTEERLLRGEHVILDIDVQGGQQVLKTEFKKVQRPNIVTIFIEPPDMATLEKRLRGRPEGADNIVLRLQNADGEIKVGRQIYDHLLTNEDGEEGKAKAVSTIVQILASRGIS